jgi:hypothetical protein
MANLVQSLLNESAQNAQQAQFTVAQKLSKKWAKSGLLEGLESQDIATMAMILENQAKQLVVESSNTGGGISNGANFTAGTGEQWAGVALPLVRKIFGQIAAKEFVSVQPMNLPAGLVFYLDFQYGNTKDPFTAGQSLYGTNTANFGNAAAGALYGSGKFGYSLNQFTASLLPVSLIANSNILSASFSDVDYNSDYSGSIFFTTNDPTSSNVLRKLAFATASLPNFDINAVRSFIVTTGSSAAATTFLSPDKTLQQFTQVVGGNIVFIVSGSQLQSTGSVGATFTIEYTKATDFATRGDFEDRTAAQGFSVPNAASNTSIVIPEINVQMKSQTISAKTRKLKAQWTPEFAQDLNAYHSLDAEAELTGLLSEYISLEIDLEVLDLLIQNAPTVEYWSARVGSTLTAGANAPTVAGTNSGLYYNQMTWFQTIGIKLQKVSNIIHQRTMRGGANFMVVSPAVATILESIPGFAADTDGAADTMKYAFGVQKVGALNSRYKVYKNPYMTENVILLGFRGTQFLEAGAVYSPYVPLIMTPLVYDPQTFTPRKGIMTRYAMTMIRPEFYGLVVVSDLAVV